MLRADHRVNRILNRGLHRNDPTCPGPNQLLGLIGAFAVEFDLNLSNEGLLFVGHPDDHGMTSKNFEALTRREIETRGMPMLEDYLQVAYQQMVTLLVELKASSPKRACRLAKELVKFIKSQLNNPYYSEDSAWLQNIAVQSFSLAALRQVAKTGEETGLVLERQLLWTSTSSHGRDMRISMEQRDYLGLNKDEEWETPRWTRAGIEVARELGCTSFNTHFSSITPAIVEEAHKAGLRIAAWTVRNRIEIGRLRRMGVDVIISEV